MSTKMPTGRSMIAGDHRFSQSGEFDGMIAGDVTVAKGVELVLNGMVNGDLRIESGAVVRLGAMVCGQVFNNGGTLLAA